MELSFCVYSPTDAWVTLDAILGEPFRNADTFDVTIEDDAGEVDVSEVLVIDANAKEVMHVAVTRQPSERWTAQQQRNATCFGTGPAVIIRDNDHKFGADFDQAANGVNARVITTAIHAPRMNATCERFLGSVRRECFDHIIILGEAHLRSLLGEYVAHLNASRPHPGIAQRVPVPPGKPSSASGGKVVAMPVLGGLHHECRRAA